ncbi:MAG: peptidylprolyl isomerase [Spirochaetaceae bacterium]|jgi:parvulin-like peptidyl-prolyl isomerase|nr:peptidylprolyl isomerase [Spirochaetaceae bacterium]
MASKTKKPKAEEESGLSGVFYRLKTHPFLFGGTILVLLIVVVAFVFVPAVPNVGGEGQDQSRVFGYYNGTPISYMYGNYFYRALQEAAAAEQFQPQSGYSADSNNAFNLWYQAFIRTVIQTGMLDEMKTAGYRAPPKEIDRRVAELPNFQEDGRFSSTKYNRVNRNERLAIWRTTEENYITGKYVNDVAGLRVSSAEKAFIGNMAFPERSFDLVSFSRSSYPDSELASFASANPDLFKTVHLSKITLAAEREARQLLDSVKGGRFTFEDAARNQSADVYKDRGGDMGLRMAYEVFTELAEESDREVLFALKPGELSSVVKAPDNSWAFFRAEETPYAPDLTIPENLEKIRSYMNRFEGGRIENWLLARVETLSAQALSQNLSLSAYLESLVTAADPALFRIFRLSRITLAEKDAAEQLRSEVQRNGISFAAAAENSIDEDRGQGGDMGRRMVYELSSVVVEETDRNTLLSLRQGELSPVVQVSGGWAFFRAEETPFTADLSLDENKDKIRNYMTNPAFSKSVLVPGDSAGIRFLFLELGPVSLNYGNVGLFRSLAVQGNAEVEQAVSSDNFWRIAFSLSLNTPSTPFTLGTSIVVLTVTGETPADEATQNSMAEWYGTGWMMYNALDADLNYSFAASPKFEDNFIQTFFSTMYQETIDSSR